MNSFRYSITVAWLPSTPNRSALFLLFILSFLLILLMILYTSRFLGSLFQISSCKRGHFSPELVACEKIAPAAVAGACFLCNFHPILNVNVIMLIEQSVLL